METRIIDYDPALQPGIDRMMQLIQSEFKIAITAPTSAQLDQDYNKAEYHFWVAMHEKEVAGTIGVKIFGGHKAEIKRMMVAPAYRGRQKGTARRLMDVALNYARQSGCDIVYLGTMEQFVAAQKFYDRYGFQRINENELPEDYVINPIDKLFYVIPLR